MEDPDREEQKPKQFGAGAVAAGEVGVHNEAAAEAVDREEHGHALQSLPFPNSLGHESGSNHHYTKHGIAAFLLGIACFVFAWFQSGPRREAGAS